MAIPTNQQGAIALSKKGLYVFPCKQDKTPYTIHGHKDATTSEEQIAAWWSQWPTALIGVNMGASNLVTFDFDNIEVYKKMVGRYPELADTYTEQTPRGGRHVILQAGEHKIASANKAFKNMGYSDVDVKASGGYIIMAPSQGANGAYIVEKDLPFAELSDELLKLLDDRGLIVNEKAYVDAAIDRLALPQNKIKADYYPPCIKRIMGDLANGVNLEHMERVYLVAFLYAIGHEPEYIKTMFASSPDYSEETTSYQVDHITKKPYKCPTCTTMAKWGYCQKDQGCRDKNPTWYYKNKFFEKWDYELNDSGAVKLLGDLYGEDILYVKPMRSWLYWTGTMWQPQDRKANKLVEIVREMSKIYKQRADFLEDYYMDMGEEKPYNNPLVKAYRSFYKAVNSKSHAEAIVDHAAHLLASRHVEKADDLDSVPHVLNVKNGLLDLNTGRLLDQAEAKKMLVTMQANVVFEPGAKCPIFDRFLDEITYNRPELKHYLLKQLGYALSGYTKEEQAFAWLGIGRNGKTKLAEIVYEILGDYAASISSQAFVLSRGGPNGRFSFARLRGKRFIKCSEVAEGSVFNVEKFKLFVGGDTITAEEKGEKEFDYKPVGKLFFLFNDMPAMPRSRATEDKLSVTPFDLNIERDKADKDLLDKLLAEKSGILNRLIEGYQAWQREGFKNLPLPVVEATEAYWREADWFSAFLAEKCFLHKDARVKNEDLYAIYKIWAEANGQTIFSQTLLSKRLKKAGFNQRLAEGGRFRVWYGLRLKETYAGSGINPALAT